MKITEIHIGQLSIPLIRPFITSVRRTECVDDVVIMIKTDRGMVGYGSAASTPAITGDSTESIIQAVQSILGPQLIGRSISEFNLLLQMNHQNIQKTLLQKQRLISLCMIYLHNTVVYLYIKYWAAIRIVLTHALQ